MSEFEKALEALARLHGVTMDALKSECLLRIATRKQWDTQVHIAASPEVIEEVLAAEAGPNARMVANRRRQEEAERFLEYAGTIPPPRGTPQAAHNAGVLADADEREASQSALEMMVARREKQRDALWQLLDDIDTLDDSCREFDLAFRDLVREVQKKRWAIHDPKGSP